MHPVTTRREPDFLASPSARTVSIDSWRAASTKAHVFTTTRSAAAASSATTRPSARRLATTLSESTAFFGHPSVSTQKDCAVTAAQATGGCSGGLSRDRPGDAASFGAFALSPRACREEFAHRASRQEHLYDRRWRGTGTR